MDKLLSELGPATAAQATRPRSRSASNRQGSQPPWLYVLVGAGIAVPVFLLITVASQVIMHPSDHSQGASGQKEPPSVISDAREPGGALAEKPTPPRREEPVSGAPIGVSSSSRQEMTSHPCHLSIGPIAHVGPGRSKVVVPVDLKWQAQPKGLNWQVFCVVFSWSNERFRRRMELGEELSLKERLSNLLARETMITLTPLVHEDGATYVAGTIEIYPLGRDRNGPGAKFEFHVTGVSAHYSQEYMNVAVFAEDETNKLRRISNVIVCREWLPKRPE